MKKKNNQDVAWREAAKNVLGISEEGMREGKAKDLFRKVKDAGAEGLEKVLNLGDPGRQTPEFRAWEKAERIKDRKKRRAAREAPKSKEANEAYSTEDPSMYDGASPNDVVNYLRGYRYAREPGPESPKEAGTEYYKKLASAAHPDKETTSMEKKGKKDAFKNDLGQDNKFPNTLESLLAKVETAINERVNPWAVCHSSTGSKKDDKFERCVRKVKRKHGIK